MSRTLLVFGVLMVFALACGSDDEERVHQPQQTPTIARTPVPTPSPTPTPAAETHWHLLIGSHHAGGGEITVHQESNTNVALLTERQCIGGAAEACVGGVILYTGSFPAFESVNEEHADEHLQPLPPGTSVEIEIVSLSPGVRLQIEDKILSQAGARALLGVVPFHAHVQWQLVLAHDVDPEHGQYVVTLRFLVPGSGYEPSAPYTLLLQVGTMHNGHHEAAS